MRTILVLLFALAALAAPAAEQAPPGYFLKYLAEGDAMILADPASQTAAQIIADAMEAASGRKVPIADAKKFDESSCEVTGTVHIIAVGTLKENAVVGRWIPAWFLDRDWYYNDLKKTTAVKIRPYEPTTGYVVGGYGEWSKDEDGVGYVEVSRSPYFMEWKIKTNMDVPKEEKTSYPKDFPMRLQVLVTGSGQAGVKAAAEAFANEALLNGVVLADDAKAAEGPDLWTLDAERYATDLPFAPPAEADSFKYLGWLEADVNQYDGFENMTGVEPVKMYRLKYMPPFGITNFLTTPHRMSGKFEVAVIRLPEDADTAAIKTALAHDGVTMIFKGDYLVIESIPEPHGSAIAGAVANVLQ